MVGSHTPVNESAYNELYSNHEGGNKNGKALVSSLSANNLKEMSVPIVEVRRTVVPKQKPIRQNSSVDIKSDRKRASLVSRHLAIQQTDLLVNIYGPQMNHQQKLGYKIIGRDKDRSLS